MVTVEEVLVCYIVPMIICIITHWIYIIFDVDESLGRSGTFKCLGAVPCVNIILSVVAILLLLYGTWITILDLPKRFKK